VYSGKPEAEALQEFVLRDDLPGVRRYGCYPAATVLALHALTGGNRSIVLDGFGMAAATSAQFATLQIHTQIRFASRSFLKETLRLRGIKPLPGAR